jgi:hypothetical protein
MRLTKHVIVRVSERWLGRMVTMVEMVAVYAVSYLNLSYLHSYPLLRQSRGASETLLRSNPPIVPFLRFLSLDSAQKREIRVEELGSVVILLNGLETLGK